MPSAHPIAVLCSDLHLSLTQPACRADKDWMAVQAGYLRQLKETAGDLPVLCAGDIFDRWNAPPELINFALEHLPDKMICVPGQHDLPNHRLDQVHRSGYGVLMNAGKILDATPGECIAVKSVEFTVHGFGWGEVITPPVVENSRYRDLPHVALIHRYCWIIDRSYPGAPEDAHLSSFNKSLRGYTAAIFGDNHKGFLTKARNGSVAVMNCGGFIRRKSDEISYQPSIGILLSDGTIKRKRLDTSGDVFHEVPQERGEVPLNLKEFIDGLEGLGEHGLDFREAVTNHLRTEEVDSETKEIILRAMEPT